MSDKEEELLGLLDRGAYQSIGAFFKNQSESERAKYADTSIEHFKRSIAKTHKQGPRTKQNLAGAHSVLCTASSEQIESLSWPEAIWFDFGAEYLADNKRDAMRGFGDVVLKTIEWHYRSPMELVFQLLALGLIDEPETTNDNYILGMISAPTFYKHAVKTSAHLGDWVKAMPIFLESGIWRFFEIEGTDLNTLQRSIRRYPKDFILLASLSRGPNDPWVLEMKNPESWPDTILQLEKDGVLSRERLLSSCLEAFERPFSQESYPWFGALHNALKPSLEEKVCLTARYINLLSSPVPSAVSIALKALLAVSKTNPLSFELIQGHLAVCLVAEPKITVISALKLLAGALNNSPEHRLAACLMAVDALHHPAIDVQVEVMSFINNHAPDDRQELLEKLSHYKSVLTPSAIVLLDKVQIVNHNASKLPALKPQAKKLAKTGSDTGATAKTTKVAGNQVATPSAIADRSRSAPEIEAVTTKLIATAYQFKSLQLPGWPLACAAPLVYIDHIDDLLRKALYCLEHPEEVIEIEVVLEAAARMGLDETMCTSPLVPPLKERARAILISKARSTSEVQKLFASFIYRLFSKEYEWLDTTAMKSSVQLLEKKIDLVLANLSAGNSLLPLSTPTHAGGWIDPQVLRKRGLAWKNSDSYPDPYDLCLALLRTPLDARQALAASADLPDELIAALKYVNGEGKVLMPLRPPLHAAALFARAPVNPSENLVVCNRNLFNADEELATIRLMQISAPVLRDCLCNVGVRNLVPMINHGQSGSEHGLKGHFELLTSSGAPLDRRALILMVVGLLFPDPECTPFTRDALISAIDEGRLDIRTFATELSAFLYSGYSKPKRLATALQEVARVGPVYADAVSQVIEYALPSDRTHIPTGFAVVLELLYELLIGANRKIEHQASRERLASMPIGGKAKVIIKKLLDMA